MADKKAQPEAKSTIRPLEVTPRPWPRDANDEKIHWSKLFDVHSLAALFELPKGEQLAKIVADIKANGLQHPIVLQRAPDGQRLKLIDGRIRLEAAMLADIPLGWVRGSDGVWWLMGKDETSFLKDDAADAEVAAFIISTNIHRRHLTKEQQADLIWKVKEAAQKNDRANIARSFSPTAGKKGGSTKDELKQAVVAEAKKHGISERTVKLARAKQQKAKAAASKFNKAKAAATKPKPKTKAKPAVPAAKPPVGIENEFDALAQQLEATVQKLATLAAKLGREAEFSALLRKLSYVEPESPAASQPVH